MDAILDDLSSQGWSVADGFLDQALALSLRDEIRALHASGAFRAAGVGRGEGFRVDPSVRSDSILWLDEAALTPVQATAWKRVDELRVAVNRGLYLGLESLESHLTVYPPGAHYGKHLDRFRDESRRTLSIVIYLNDAWEPTQGGQLRLFDRDAPDTEAALVAPRLGTLACFISSEIWHEVLPMTAPRYSLTGWFLRRSSGERATPPAAPAP